MLATPVWKYQQEGRRAQPFFGFMPLSGRACVEPVQKADAVAMEAFLELIRKQNNDGMPIGLIVNNARIYHARSVKQKARELAIHLLFLPPYLLNLTRLNFSGRSAK